MAILAKELHDTQQEGDAGALFIEPAFLASAGARGCDVCAGHDASAGQT